MCARRVGLGLGEVGLRDRCARGWGAVGRRVHVHKADLCVGWCVCVCVGVCVRVRLCGRVGVRMRGRERVSAKRANICADGALGSEGERAREGGETRRAGLRMTAPAPQG